MHSLSGLRSRALLALVLACGTGCAVGAAPDTDDAAQQDAAPRDTGAVGQPDAAAPLDAAVPADGEEPTPEMTPDGSPPPMDASTAQIAIGGTARVTADVLNLRSGPGTSNSVVTTMVCGTQVNVIGGPSSGWWNIRYGTDAGWASGVYLIAEEAFDPALCGSTTTTDAGASTGDAGGMPSEVAAIFERARAGVGYSYYWGHGSWGTDGTSHGSCSGNCPSCTHSGRYGADCSGYVSKVWQVPGPSPLTTDAHPYSAGDYTRASPYWHRISRSEVQPGDVLAYTDGSEGHSVLYESGDPWGSMWTYEARGCSYGIVHNLRTLGSMFVAARRTGL